jgi:hypothetical protein
MVGTEDLSGRVVAENYKIGTKPEYDLWTDANGREHRSKYRERVQGTLELKFLSINEYQDFVFLLENNVNTDLTYPMTVYDNISEQEKEIVGFIDYEPTRYRAPDWADMVERITVTIREQ